MFVVMAIVTTWITSPAIWLLYRKRQHELKGELDVQLPVASQPTVPIAAAAQEGPAAQPAGAGGSGAAVAAPLSRRRKLESQSVVFLYSSKGHEASHSSGTNTADSTAGAEAADAGPTPAAAALAMYHTGSHGGDEPRS